MTAQATTRYYVTVNHQKYYMPKAVYLLLVERFGEVETTPTPT